MVNENEKQDESFERRASEVIPSAISSGDALEKKENTSTGFSRKADVFTGGGSYGGGNVARAPLMYWDPLLDPALFLFPKDRLDEINKRYRHYYETHPIVGPVIDNHSEYPLSDFELEVEDSEIKNYYNDFKNRKKLLEMYHFMIKDYFITGEGIFYGNWDINEFEWKDFIQVPMENVDVYSSYLSDESVCFLKPDPELKSKIKESSEAYKILEKHFEPEYLDSVVHNKPYFLNPSRMIRLIRRSSKYQRRGLSIIRRCIRDLMSEDKLYVLRITFIDRHYAPLKIFKLGSETNKWIPPESHFKTLQGLYAQGLNDPDFAIFYHFGVHLEVHEPRAKINEVRSDIEFSEKRIMLALMANPALLKGETGSYAQSAVSMRMLMHSYLMIRDLIEVNTIYKIFLPLAEKRGYIKRTSAELNHGIRVNSSSDIDNLVKNGLVDLSSLKIGQAGLIKTFVKTASGPRITPVVARKTEDGFRILGGREYLQKTLRDRYHIPKLIWKKMNLMNNSQMIQMIMSLRDKGEIPFQLIADTMGWDADTLSSWMKKESGTMVDKNYRDSVKSAITKDPDALSKFISGADFDEVIRTLKLKDKVNKDKEEDADELSTMPIQHIPSIDKKPIPGVVIKPTPGEGANMDIERRPIGEEPI